MRLLATLALLTATAAWAGAVDERPEPSPRTFVVPASCYGQTPCPGAYWLFRPPDCRDGELVHPPGTVVRFGDDTVLQCRCRLTWLWTKVGEPPAAKVTCRWIDVREAWQEE